MSTHFTVSRDFLKWDGDRSWPGTRVHYRYILLDGYSSELILYLDQIIVEERSSTRHKWKSRIDYDRLKRHEEPILSQDINDEALEIARKAIVVKPWRTRI